MNAPYFIWWPNKQDDCDTMNGCLLVVLQLGYGTPLGAKAAANSARFYLKHLPNDQVLFSLDFNENAFNGSGCEGGRPQPWL